MDRRVVWLDNINYSDSKLISVASWMYWTTPLVDSLPYGSHLPCHPPARLAPIQIGTKCHSWFHQLDVQVTLVNHQLAEPRHLMISLDMSGLEFVQSTSLVTLSPPVTSYQIMSPDLYNLPPSYVYHLMSSFQSHSVVISVKSLTLWQVTKSIAPWFPWEPVM